MNNNLSRYNFWRNDVFFDSSTREELAALDPVSDRQEIEDRFYRELEFGTGGLRGVMGAGTNRMNRYTVGRATAGLGSYLLKVWGERECFERGIAIGYDTRNNSELFAQTVANVLSSMNIRVHLSSAPIPTPQLSFSIGLLNALAGVVITASHNPKEYNGYKIYDECGDQLVPDKVVQVTESVRAVTDYRTIDFSGKRELVSKEDVTDDFVAAVLKQSRYHDAKAKARLHVIYTSLHGTGDRVVNTVLRKDGFQRVERVEAQMIPDGNFSTVRSPNPEDRQALSLGIEQAQRRGADIVLGTDPDCDRVGAAVRSGGTYHLVTGNQMGALLVDFILHNTDLNQYTKPAFVKTVVTSELGAEIVRRYGERHDCPVAVFSTLTGFKFIGEKITQFEQAKANGDVLRGFDFIFGWEESYGYLAGTHVRDKDAVVASMLICEMAAKLKTEGKTLLDRLAEIYAEYGYYMDALDSFTLEGKNGAERICCMMKDLRGNGVPFEGITRVIDYSATVEAESGFGLLPKSNVLKYLFNDDSWVAVRPSGTEPKIKIYYSVRANSGTAAEKRLGALRKAIKSRLGL